jgi:hypothetical protein
VTTVIVSSDHVAGFPEGGGRFWAHMRQVQGPWCVGCDAYWRERLRPTRDPALCYFASGKPAAMQHTGRSRFLPNGGGLFRFVTLDDAVAAQDAVNTDYEGHCRAAREIAEGWFGTRRVLTRVLNAALPATRC